MNRQRKSRRIFSRPQGRFQMPRRVLIGSVVLCGMLAIAFGSREAWRSLAHADYFRIRKIICSGYTRLSEASLRRLIGVQTGESIFLVDLERVGDRVKAHPWVKRVTLRRVLPHELFIAIEERTPFAIVDTGKNYVIDVEGYVLQEFPSAGEHPYVKIQGLSKRVYGPGDQITDPALRTGLRLLAAIRNVEIFHALTATEIDVHDPERPLLVLGDNQLTVRVASEDLESKLHLLRLITAYITQRERDIEHIDLSFRDKIVMKSALVTAATRE